jgi:hypothetical protein
MARDAGSRCVVSVVGVGYGRNAHKVHGMRPRDVGLSRQEGEVEVERQQNKVQTISKASAIPKLACGVLGTSGCAVVR